MVDVQKYSDIYKELVKLTPDDTLKLVIESKSDEENEFYEMIGDFLLQKAQQEAIAETTF